MDSVHWTPVTSEMTAAAVEKPATAAETRNKNIGQQSGGRTQAETKIETSQTSSSEGRPATAAMHATVETPTIVSS
jgi:hypothetical protein